MNELEIFKLINVTKYESCNIVTNEAL